MADRKLPLRLDQYSIALTTMTSAFAEVTFAASDKLDLDGFFAARYDDHSVIW
ncbi:hypothetical protein [Lentibacter algarum]|uniref:hypothetical protein n=1 Tax=Lentibacter algarum TaxID=576131 RepID=UPI003AF5209E